jgi:hypothetical protein
MGTPVLVAGNDATPVTAYVRTYALILRTNKTGKV